MLGVVSVNLSFHLQVKDVVRLDLAISFNLLDSVSEPSSLGQRWKSWTNFQTYLHVLYSLKY